MKQLMKQFMEQMNNRFAQMEKNIEELRQELRDHVGELKQEIRNNQVENRSHFKHIESQLNQHKVIFEMMTGENESSKLNIKYLTDKTDEHDAELKRIKKHIQQ